MNLVEFDAGAELDATECSDVVDAKIVGGTDLSSGRGRQMEYDRDGRREFRWRVGGAGEWHRQICISGAGTGRQSLSCERATRRCVDTDGSVHEWMRHVQKGVSRRTTMTYHYRFS
jgi:hypothetical protein